MRYRHFGKRKKALVVSVSSHLHDRPGAGVEVSAIREASGKLIATPEGSEKSKNFEILFASDSLEAGTIKITGLDSFNGIYRK